MKKADLSRKDVLDLVQQAINEKLSTLKGVSVKFNIKRYERDGSAAFGNFTVFALDDITQKAADSDPAKMEWEKHCSKYNLTAFDYGRVIKIQHKTFTLSGIATKNYKKPILATDSRGKVYKLSIAQVKMGMNNTTTNSSIPSNNNTQNKKTRKKNTRKNNKTHRWSNYCGKSRWDQYAHILGMNKSDFGLSCKHGLAGRPKTNTVKVIGVFGRNPSKAYDPVIVQGPQGGVYRCTVNEVINNWV